MKSIGCFIKEGGECNFVEAAETKEQAHAGLGYHARTNHKEIMSTPEGEKEWETRFNSAWDQAPSE